MSLAKSSPALFGLLRRSFPATAIALAEECFALSLQLGGLEDSAVFRAEGVSFNPKPARLALILLNETSFRELELVCSAMLMSVPLTNIQHCNTIKISTQHLTATWTLLDAPSLCSQIETNTSSLALALVWALDHLRHIHMTTLSPLEIKALADQLHSLAMLTAVPEVARLQQLLAHICNRILSDPA